jgi:hypothetical protein
VIRSREAEIAIADQNEQFKGNSVGQAKANGNVSQKD